MLSPELRRTLTDALQPPVGYGFDWGIATTYSLDLTTLLTVPLHLALFPQGWTSPADNDPIALLEGLRRVASRLLVVCQEGRILTPAADHPLFGLLDGVIVQARAPAGGSFHAKTWLLRYAPCLEDEGPWLRLMILSRNLTADRSWDAALVLDGEPGGRVRAVNRPLVEFLETLPKMTSPKLSCSTRERLASLAEEVRTTVWDLPEGFKRLEFHVLGLGKGWRRKWSGRIAVVSPFCSDEALGELASRATTAVAVVSRPDSLQALKPQTLSLFQRQLILDDAADFEDGEDAVGARVPGTDSPAVATRSELRGLHAKLYLMEDGQDLRIAVGSPNATDQAILHNANVEILAELSGSRRTLGGIDAFLGPEGLGELLTDFQPAAQPEVDEARREAEDALQAATQAICKAGLRASCRGKGDVWEMAVTAPTPLSLPGIAGINLRLATLPAGRTWNGAPLTTGQPVILRGVGKTSLTGLVVFEMTAAAADLSEGFVLNLPVEGLPDDRDAAILAQVVSTREDLLRYLLLLLADVDEPGLATDALRLLSHAKTTWGRGRDHTLPLLEEMVRVFSRAPDRLQYVDDAVSRFEATPEGEGVLPEGFLELWEVFREALKLNRQERARPPRGS